MKQRIRSVFWQTLNYRGATLGEKAQLKSPSRFTSTLVRVGIYENTIRVLAPLHAEESLTGKLDPVVCSEELHQAKPMRGQITGRYIPTGPGCGRIRVVLSGLGGWRPHAV